VCRSLSGADDPDTIFVVRLGVVVNDHQDDSGTDHADGMPALLVAFHAVRKDQVKRVTPNLPRQLEGYLVLGEI
jgi:hypothetical protein